MYAAAVGLAEVGLDEEEPFGPLADVDALLAQLLRFHKIVELAIGQVDFDPDDLPALGVEHRAGELRIVVRDEGPGLNAEQQDLVIHMFERGSEDPNIAGSGIGLTIVRLIATHLGGTVRLEGGAGFFSTFVLNVPTGNREAA